MWRASCLNSGRPRALPKSTIWEAAKSNACSILEAFQMAERITGRPMTYRYVDENRDRRSHLLLQRPPQNEERTIRLGTSARISIDIFEEIAASWMARLGAPADTTKLTAHAQRMKLLITGICGFVGSSIAEGLLERRAGISIVGIDNLMRPGSELNRSQAAETRRHSHARRHPARERFRIAARRWTG